MKRPEFIIFTDKDCTINLEDKKLNNIFHLVSTMGGMVIPVTGRTVGDIEENIRQKNIRMPEIIVGDNGANIYLPNQHTFIIQKKLEHKKVMDILHEYLKNGGNIDFVRYTNGENIFASDQEDVREYYRNSKKVKFCSNIYEKIQQAEDITKLTLAGRREDIEQRAKFIQNLDFWTDMDRTRFPKKEYENYRLDIAQKNISKGEAVKALVAKLKPQYGYLCVGNGRNDISMFETAIDNGMIAAIMSNSDPELIDYIEQYAKGKKGEVKKVPLDRDLANEYILKMAKEFQSRQKTREREIREKKRLPNVERVKVGKLITKKENPNVEFKRKNLER